MRVTRLRAAAVAAVVLAGLVAGTGVAGVPARADGTVTVGVTTLDREGAAVSVTVALQSAGSLAVQDQFTSGESVQVPPGSYNVAAQVWEPNYQAVTVVDQEITVTSSTAVVLDARGGHPVTFTVNDPTVHQDEVSVDLFSPQVPLQAFESPVIRGAKVYVVPSALPAGWKVAVQGDLIRAGNGLSPVEYSLIRVFSGAIPASLTFASTTASLARDHVTVRAVDPHETDGFANGPVVPGFGTPPNPYQLGMMSQVQAAAPYAVDLYVTPGYQWVVQAASNAGNIDYILTGTLSGGHAYSHVLNSAVFGPSPLLNLSNPTGELSADQWGYGYPWYLLTDPAWTPGPTFGQPSGLAPSKPELWIYRGSTLLAHVTGWPNGTVTAPLTSTEQWYTMRVQADRYSLTGASHLATGLAKSQTASFTFRASEYDFTVGDEFFWPRIVPQGLSGTNAARHGTKTVVPVTFATTAGVIAVHGVKAWASVNGGKTWTALAVSSSGGGRAWRFTVTNPSKAGWVSLRVQGTNAAGFTASVTATNAYAVS
jgi:hypothetical protein